MQRSRSWRNRLRDQQPDHFVGLVVTHLRLLCFATGYYLGAADLEAERV
jgi:hypothetical protein